MNYREKIQATIDYIEEHLNETISLCDLAGLACFSEFHYHRMFQWMVGVPVMDYIRKRRLSQAALALRESKRRVVDVALEYGFQSHETFARAFKRQFQVTPDAYRRAGLSLALQPRIILPEIPATGNRGGHHMQPKLVTKPSFKVIGYALETNVNEGRNHLDIPAFWQRYLSEGLGKHIPNKLRPDVELGICTDFQPATGDFKYVIGYEVDTFDGVPEGMVCVTIPEATYAVFTTPKATAAEFSSSIQTTWGKAYQDWFPESGYVHGASAEFEWYDDRCASGDERQMDIYLPIQKKEVEA